jgi:D-alanyl-D-alanine endopeptidase (penicillin-binding protein 7)
VSYSSPPKHSGYYSSQDDSFLSSLVNKIIPGKIGIKAKAAIVVNPETGEVLYSKNENLKLPIASLTKLATALVFVNANQNLNQPIVISRNDLKNGGRTRLYRGDQITVNDCLHLCLMRSDNIAAKILIRAAGLEENEFILLMNELAKKLNMHSTNFADPSGLHANNVSTAEDLTKLIQAACNNEIISNIISKKMYQYKPLNRATASKLYNTNRLLYGNWDIKGGKTGFINKAGYCLALDAKDEKGKHISAIILGSPSSNYRFKDAERLLLYALRD